MAKFQGFLQCFYGGLPQGDFTQNKFPNWSESIFGIDSHQALFDSLSIMFLIVQTYELVRRNLLTSRTLREALQSKNSIVEMSSVGSFLPDSKVKMGLTLFLFFF